MRRAWLLGVFPVVLSGSCRDYDALRAGSDPLDGSTPRGGHEARGGEAPSTSTSGASEPSPAGGAGGRAYEPGERGGESTNGGELGGTASAGERGAGGDDSGGEAGSDSSAGSATGSGGTDSPTRALALGAQADSPGLLAARRVAPPHVASLPRAYDLSDRVPPPGNQGAESSAVAWAVATTKSFLTAKQNGWSILSTRYQFSPAWIYSQIAGGRDDGARPSDALDLLVNQGADTSFFFPHRVSSFRAIPDPASFKRAARFKATHWGTLQADLLTLKRSLASQQPAVVTFEVYPDFDALDDDNWLYDDSSGASRGRYAAVLVGYDDDKAAFKVLSSWGTDWGEAGFGWLAYSLVEPRVVDLAAYVLSEGSVAPPATAPNLYVVENQQLWRVDGDYGDYTTFGKPVWGQSEAIATMAGSLFVVQGAWLHRVNPVTGSFSIVGESLSAGNKLLTELGDALFLISAGVLWKITDFATGHRDRASTADFSRATALAAVSEALFAVQDGVLMRIDPRSGAASALGDAVWYGPIWMAAIAGKLYLMNRGALWVVDDLATGSARRLGHEDWTNGSVLATHNGALYALRDHQLWLVNSQLGTSEALGGAVWTVGTVIMAGLR